MGRLDVFEEAKLCCGLPLYFPSAPSWPAHCGSIEQGEGLYKCTHCGGCDLRLGETDPFHHWLAWRRRVFPRARVFDPLVRKMIAMSRKLIRRIKT